MLILYDLIKRYCLEWYYSNLAMHIQTILTGSKWYVTGRHYTADIGSHNAKYRPSIWPIYKYNDTLVPTLDVPAKFRENTAIIFCWVTLQKVNVMDRQTDGGGGGHYNMSLPLKLHNTIHLDKTSLLLNNIKIRENQPNLTFPTLNMTFWICQWIFTIHQ